MVLLYDKKENVLTALNTKSLSSEFIKEIFSGSKKLNKSKLAE